LLKDEDADVRKAAGQALRKIHGDPVREVIARVKR
jgi:hypothetical protein